MNILYHQAGCGQCQMAKMLLDRENIDYISSENVSELEGLGVKKTPTLIIKDENDTITEIILGAKGVKDWIERRKRA